MSSLKEDDQINNDSCRIQHHREQEEDRLSSLPDTLLITILSLLPTPSAVATSALSRRWRHLWTHITHLNFLFPLNHKPFNSFVTTVDHIISQLKSPKIHTFNLHLSSHSPTHLVNATEVSSAFLVPWFHHVCRRNPEVIKVNFRGVDPLYNDDFQIPFCLFETQSLVQLHLNLNFEVEFLYDKSRMSSIKFPNLKKLALDLSDPNITLIERNGPLFAACPLLEELNLSVCFTENDHIVEISTPNLKCLGLCVKADVWNKCKLVINSPKLEKCHIEGELMHYEFLKYPSCLQEVVIWGREVAIDDGSDCISKILGLIRRISCVRYHFLEEFGSDMIGCASCSDMLPNFRNLTHLSFTYDSYAWLEALPGRFLLGNVKRVDIRDVEGDAGDNKGELTLVQHILSTATVLEKLHIYVFDDEPRIRKHQKRKEFEFCKKLFMLSKSSVNCQIGFFGNVIIASSKNFKDGVLTFHIKDRHHTGTTRLAQACL